MKSMSMKKNKALLAEWSTPQDLFDKLDAEFGFTLDVCAQPFNAKCKKFFTPDDDGLSQDWGGETAFCCPPSGKKSFREWTAKARKESKKRKDAEAEFERSGREDLIKQNKEEIEILAEYLPKQISVEEVETIVKTVIEETGATSMKDMGTVMKSAKEKIGASADGRTISEVVKKMLS